MIKSYIFDFFQSIFHPIQSQKTIRDKDAYISVLANEKDDQISTLRRDLKECKESYHSTREKLNDTTLELMTARDMLADAIFERTAVDKEISAVQFGTETHDDEDGNRKEYVIAHVWIDSNLVTGQGETHVDALIHLYEKAKNSKIEAFQNADYPKQES